MCFPAWEDSFEAGFSVTSRGDPERYIGALCDEGLFRTLHVKPLLGRGFRREDGLPGRDAVAILSYGLWKQRFGGDSHILGRALLLTEAPAPSLG